MVTPEAGAIFVHGRTGTLYFYHEEVEGFVNAFGEAYTGFWGVETPHVVPPATPLPLHVDLSTYPAAALNRGWFLTAATAPAVPHGRATLAFAFQLAPGHYPLMQAVSFDAAKAEFDKARVARSGVATPSNKPTIGVAATPSMAGTTAVGTSKAVGVGSGPLYQQRQLTRPVGQPFANKIIPTPAAPFSSVQPPVSLPHSPPRFSISPTLVNYPSPPISSLQQTEWPAFLQPPANLLFNSPLLGQVPALDLSRIPQLPQMQGQMPSWNIAAEQTGEELPIVESNPGMLVDDMSGMEATMGENADALPTADQFAQSLSSLPDEQKIVSFYAQQVTVENAAWMERMAKETLMKPTQVTSALTIPTPVGNAIVSLTTTQTTPTTSTTTCALSVSEELIRTLRQVAQQNAEFPQQL